MTFLATSLDFLGRSPHTKHNPKNKMPVQNAAMAVGKLINEVMTAQENLKEPVPVIHQGDKILLPEGMTYKDAKVWIDRQEKAEMTVVKIHSTIECYPLDGLIALSRAFREIYGFTDLQNFKEGLFGRESAPPVFIEVATPTGIESAPYGQMMPPKWEGGWLRAEFSSAAIVINGEVRRMFEREVQTVIERTKELLRAKSIYRGQAIQVDLEWLLEDEGFDPVSDAPKFMELSNTNLILNKITKFELETSIFMLIEHTEECRKNGIPIKHGALLKGTFGVGKTMTAKCIAKKSVDNGWTFIYLKRANQLAEGLRLAKMYAPAVIFAEDIDTVVSERDEDMNDLLNTIDGVDTKDAPIITILTTNKPDDIEPSFLRAGRIDSVITFAAPEADTAMEFVRVYGGENLKQGEDLTKVGEALAGLVPAFICEAVSKAKRYAIHRTGSANIIGKVTADDLLLAAQSVAKHVQLLNTRPETPDEKLLGHINALREYNLDPLKIQGEQIANRLGI